MHASSAGHLAPGTWLDGARDALRTAVTDAGGRVGLVVCDLQSNDRIDSEADVVFPSASVIKIPVLVAAIRLAELGRLDLDRPLAVPDDARVPGTGVLKDLRVAMLPMRDLLMLMIVLSDNTATNICIEHLGYDEINATVKQAGCAHTRLRRLLMDYEARARGIDNETTAGDMARFLTRLSRGELLSAAGTDYAMDVLRRQQSWWGLPRLLPEDVDLPHKTGELSGLRHDVGILYAGGRQVVISVLCDGFTDPATRDGHRGGAASDVHAQVGLLVYSAMTSDDSSG